MNMNLNRQVASNQLYTALGRSMKSKNKKQWNPKAMESLGNGVCGK